MARKNTASATRYKSVKQITNMSGGTDYLVSFNYKGTRIPTKNFTKLFGCTTAKQASDYIVIVKSNIDNGQNPFCTSTNTIDNLATDYLEEKKGTGTYNAYMYNYKNHIKDVIGHKFIDKVTEDDLKKIRQNMKSKGLKDGTIKRVKRFLSPIFRKAFIKGLIKVNIIHLVEMGQDTPKPRMTQRLNGSLKKSIRIIYNQALKEENPNVRAMFLISIMCTRRFNEILLIEYEDISDGVVHVRGSTTKTFKSQGEKVVERYPLPDEVLDIIGTGTGKVFKYHYQKYHKNYSTMIDKCKLDLKELAKEYPIRSHDNRSFIMSIASDKFGTETVGTLALSHRSKNNINDVYLTVEYKRVKKLFDWYWKKIRKEDK